VEFRLLGPFEVAVDGESIPLGGAKQRTLLALLAIHANEPVSVDRLIDELWGDHPPESAANTLQAYISRLRKILEPNVVNGASRLIASVPRGYELQAEPDQLDSQRFVRLVAAAGERAGDGRAEEVSTLLAEALALWRGPALADFGSEPFARNEIARLDELRLTALEDRIEADLACGRHARLVAELDGLVTEQPFRERLRGQLMLALYRSGRQADALETYRTGRRRLVDELGLEPGPRLQELERAILTQDPALDLPEAHSPPSAVPRRRPKRSIVVAAAAALAALAVTAGVVLFRGDAAAPAGVPVRPHAVAVIDPASDTVVATRRIGGWPLAMTSGGGYVWAANTGDDTVSRIDPSGRIVLDTFFATTPLDISWWDGVIWIANGNSYDGPDPPGGGTVERYDVATRELTQTRITPPADNVLTFVAAGPEGAWAASPAQSRAFRLDPRSGKIVATVSETIQVTGLAVGSGSVWVSDAINNVVVRIDPGSNRVVARIPVGDGPRRLAVGEGSVWAVAEFPRSGLWRIDPRTNRTVAHIELPSRPEWICIGGGSVWVTSNTPGHAGPGSLARIDPSTNEVVATIDLGFSPEGVVFANGLVWVAIGPM
jgi:YVTN family beta-propeller protein